MYIVTIGWVHD